MEKLRKFREGIGISQCNMARELDISLSFYEKIERGHAQPSRGFMQKIKRAFPKISIDEVFLTKRNFQRRRNQ